MKILHEKELQFVQVLNSSASDWQDLKHAKEIKDYIGTVQRSAEDPKYINHPINLFNLLKRTTYVTPKILNAIGKANRGINKILRPTDRNDFRLGAALGLLNIQHFHGLDPKDFVDGCIKDLSSGIEYKSGHKLTSSDAVMIAQLASKLKMVSAAVTWAEAAVHAAKGEGLSKKNLKMLKRQVRELKDHHDDSIVKHGWLHLEKDEGGTHLVQLNNATFHPDSMYDPRVEAYLKQRKDFEDKVPMFKNLFETLTKDEHVMVPLLLEYFLWNTTVRLCNGETLRPPEMDKRLMCKFLHRSDPWLKLGPFKYEVLNQQPHVGIFRDFASPADMEAMKSVAKGRMKATPLIVGGKDLAYSIGRISKIMYQSVHHGHHVKRISKNIELAMNMNSVSREKYDSENFQVMNYGLGGQIRIHVDSYGVGLGKIKLESEKVETGGLRFPTFMIYMSNVEAGGRTIFPQSGISVKPKFGDALFWFNIDSGGTIDSRNFHIGCPVIYGNKWISNKWIKWLAQWKNYSCHYIQGKPFEPY